MYLLRVIAPLVAATAGLSCSNTHVQLDPFGRPYDPANAVAPGPLKSCTPKDVDVPPRLLSGTRPLYPVGELIQARSAKVRLVFTVQADGMLTVPALNDRAAPQWFLRHAVIAMRDWKVIPAVKDGRSVASECQIDFDYSFW